ncbi:MAG: MBL fold metallo-hydrolase, partial [Oscillospiraceae bacterium]|nr:MBL fold metallo-hydrolase [Oscillospiraceae bacterium]
MIRSKSVLISFILTLCFIFTGCAQLEDAVSQQGTEKGRYNNTVTTLDVGQAACVLIESDGQFALIDAGKAGGGTDVTSYLHQRGVEKVDLLVISHFHYDHTSEALDVIRNFEIGTVLIPALTHLNIPDTYFYKSLIEDAKNGYYSLEYACKDKSFAIGDGVVKVLADTPDTDNINNTSIALSYTRDDFVYINTADNEKDMDEYLTGLVPENVTLYAAAHHGSGDANSYELLEKLNPSLMTVS